MAARDVENKQLAPTGSSWSAGRGHDEDQDSTEEHEQEAGLAAGNPASWVG